MARIRDLRACHILLACAELLSSVHAQHHMKRPINPRQSGASNLEIVIANKCTATIWPGIVTQGGSGPSATGFELDPGSNHTITVTADWQGRIWGRTNCTYDDPNSSGECTTGECGALDCKQAGNPPATLAEFTMDGGQSQTFYDISLVDGYNLPMAIVLVTNNIPQLRDVKASSTNPSCVGSVNNLAAQSFNPYNNHQLFLGTDSSDPLDFDTQVSSSSVAKWCPWDLQVNPPQAPGSGVYPYPDGNVPRPTFNPCFSACAKYNTPQYCCTGKHDGSEKCSPNYYSQAAKTICPDAYSYAYDDQDSTFIVPKGGEFQVIFCPGGRSTKIIASNQKAGGSTSGSSSRKRSLPVAGGAAWDGVWVAVWLIVLLGVVA